MKTKNNITFAAFSSLLFAITRAEAQLSYSVTDLGTLGGLVIRSNFLPGPDATRARNG
jgi:hypothetical protein